jgi:hypothetical protein
VLNKTNFQFYQVFGQNSKKIIIMELFSFLITKYLQVLFIYP